MIEYWLSNNNDLEFKRTHTHLSEIQNEIQRNKTKKGSLENLDINYYISLPYNVANNAKRLVSLLWYVPKYFLIHNKKCLKTWSD